MFDFSSIVGFDWEKENKQKDWEKHRVDFRECEEAFFNRPLLVGEDRIHTRNVTMLSDEVMQEDRYFSLSP